MGTPLKHPTAHSTNHHYSLFALDIVYFIVSKRESYQNSKPECSIRRNTPKTPRRTTPKKRKKNTPNIIPRKKTKLFKRAIISKHQTTLLPGGLSEMRRPQNNQTCGTSSTYTCVQKQLYI